MDVRPEMDGCDMHHCASFPPSSFQVGLAPSALQPSPVFLLGPLTSAICLQVGVSQSRILCRWQQRDFDHKMDSESVRLENYFLFGDHGAWKNYFEFQVLGSASLAAKHAWWAISWICRNRTESQRLLVLVWTLNSGDAAFFCHGNDGCTAPVSAMRAGSPIHLLPSGRDGWSNPGLVGSKSLKSSHQRRRRRQHLSKESLSLCCVSPLRPFSSLIPFGLACWLLLPLSAHPPGEASSQRLSAFCRRCTSANLFKLVNFVWWFFLW